MKNPTKHLLYKGMDIGRQNVVWNIVGSFVYVPASMALSFLVIRVVGDGQEGILSSKFSALGQQMFIVAHSGVRPFQITDGTGECSFGDYLEYRNIIYIMALVAGVVFPTSMHGVGRYPVDECMILILLVMYEVVDGYVDVCELELRHQGSLHFTGESNFFRTPFSVSIFLVTLAAFEHLLFSCLAAVAAQATGIALFNLDVIHVLPLVDWNKGEGETGRLFKSTLFLLISAFLDFYVFSAIKYATDARMNDAASEYFNLIFVPTFVIYMVANLIIRPFLARLIDLWTGRDYDCFKKELMCIGAIILGLTVPVMGATAALEKQVLSAMEMTLGSGYEGRLVSYCGAFAIIVLGGRFYALASLMYYVLVTMRRQKAIFTVCLAAVATTVASSDFPVSKFGINGVVDCYLLLMIGLVIDFGLYTMGTYQNEKKENADNGGGST